MSFENEDLRIIDLAIAGTPTPAHIFRNYDLARIYDAIISANSFAPTLYSFRDSESSGNTTSATGLAFGTTYALTIPAGKKALILATGGNLIGQAATVDGLTYTGFYLTFSGGFLPTGFYFGDINGQTPTKIKVGGSYVYLENVSPVGSATNLTASNALSAEIINTSANAINVTLQKAVKTTGVYTAAWNSAAGQENLITAIIL